jgi:hypothetical protein
MSHQKKLILWPGFGSLLAWFFEPEGGIGIAMILLVALTAYVPAALAEAPRRSPRIIAFGAFLIWFAIFWLLILAVVPFRIGHAEWASVRLAPGWDAASASLLILALFALAGLTAGVVQVLVLRRNGVPVRMSYSLIGLTAGFTILGCGFVWHMATGNDMTLALSAFLCAVPALMLLEVGRAAPASRFPVHAVLMGENIVTGGAAATSAVIATGVAGLAVAQSGLLLVDLSPIGRHGTTLLSLGLLWCLTFIAAMGLALLLQFARIHKARPAAAGRQLSEPENPVPDTDGWSIAAMMMAVGLVTMSVLLLGLAGIEALGVADILPRQILVAMLVTLFMTARGTFGAMLDFLFLGLVVWGLYGLYVVLTLDPVNVWVNRAVTVLIPG